MFGRGALSPEIIAALTGRRRVRNKYGGTVRRDPNYTPPAETSVAETSGVMSNKLTTPQNNITSLAGFTKPDKSRF